MSDTKFTLGNWSVSEGVSASHRYITSDKPLFGYCPLEIASMNLMDEPEQMANAHLIASAPDLYEALCDMVSDRNELSQATIRFAENALEKARGEQ